MYSCWLQKRAPVPSSLTLTRTRSRATFFRTFKLARPQPRHLRPIETRLRDLSNQPIIPHLFKGKTCENTRTSVIRWVSENQTHYQFAKVSSFPHATLQIVACWIWNTLKTAWTINMHFLGSNGECGIAKCSIRCFHWLKICSKHFMHLLDV